MAGAYLVNLTGGGPWGFRLQGGKDFGKALSISRVTPGGKADLQGVLEGDIVDQINDEPTEHLVHLDAQNLIKLSRDTLQLRLVRKSGNIATSMGSKSPIVITDIKHSARIDHKFNAKPRPFGVQSSPVQVKPVSKPATEPDHFDSDVLRMLRNSNISDSGLATSSSRQTGDEDIDGESDVRGNVQSRSFRLLEKHLNRKEETDDDLPPPPPEAYQQKDELPVGQSRTFKLLQRHIDGGSSEAHPSVLSQTDGNRNLVIPRPRPYMSPSSKPPVQTPMNTKEPPPCPPGVKPLQVLPSEVQFTSPSDAARSAYAERRQLTEQPADAGPPPPASSFQLYRPALVTAPAPRPKPSEQPADAGPSPAAPSFRVVRIQLR